MSIEQFEANWNDYVNYLIWRGYKLGLKPVSFRAYVNRMGAYLPDELIAIYKQTGNLMCGTPVKYTINGND